MKALVVKLINFYNTNAKFHSLVVMLEMTAVSFFTAYQGGIPAGRSGWIALAVAFGGMLWSAFKRWLATNVATVGVIPKQ